MLLIWNNQCKHLRYKMCCKNATVSSLEHGPCVWGGACNTVRCFQGWDDILKKNEKMKNKNCFCLKILFQFSEHSKATMLQMLHKCPDRIKQKIKCSKLQIFPVQDLRREKTEKNKTKKQTWHTHFMKKKNQCLMQWQARCEKPPNATELFCTLNHLQKWEKEKRKKNL